MAPDASLLIELLRVVKEAANSAKTRPISAQEADSLRACLEHALIHQRRIACSIVPALPVELAAHIASHLPFSPSSMAALSSDGLYYDELFRLLTGERRQAFFDRRRHLQRCAHDISRRATLAVCGTLGSSTNGCVVYTCRGTTMLPPVVAMDYEGDDPHYPKVLSVVSDEHRPVSLTWRDLLDAEHVCIARCVAPYRRASGLSTSGGGRLVIMDDRTMWLTEQTPFETWEVPVFFPRNP